MRTTARSWGLHLMTPLKGIKALAVGAVVLVVAFLLEFGLIALVIRLLVGDTGI